MKKLFCMALVFMAFVSAVTNVSASASDYKEAEAVLSRLNIIDARNNDVFDPEAEITRGEFAIYAAKLLNISAEQNKSYFTDVSVNDTYANAITALVETGAIHGVGGTSKFYPDDFITAPQMYKILLCALGYEEIAELMGGYPNGYIKIAQELDIAQNVSGDRVKMSEMISILHSVCMADRYGIAGVVNNSDEISAGIYKSLYGLEYSEGIVSAAGGPDINDSGRRINRNEFEIDGISYLMDEGSDAFDYIGSYVRVFYYPENTYRLNNEVFYVNVVEKYDDSEIIESENFQSYSKTGINYTSNQQSGRTRSIKLENESVVIFNRVIADKNIDKLFVDFNAGNIVLKDMDRDGIHDLVIVNSLKNYVVSKTDAEMESIYIKYPELNNKKISADDYSEFCVVDEYGKKVDIKDILTMSVLMVSESPDKTSFNAEISLSTAKGKVDGTGEEDGYYYVKIDGEKYLCSKDSEKYIKQYIRLGNAYTFYLDGYGRIAYASDYIDDGYIWGVLVKSFLNEDNLTANLKIFNENGEMKSYQLSDKAVIDGERIKTADQQLKAIENISVPYHNVATEEDKNERDNRKLIRYKVDTEGRIIKVDSTESGNEKQGESVQVLDYGQMKYDGDYRLGMKVTVDADTKVFRVPNMPSFEEKDYSLSKQFTHRFEYSTIAYTVNENKKSTDAIVVYGSAGSSMKNEWDAYLVTDFIDATVNEDGEVVSKITVANGIHGEHTYVVAEDALAPIRFVSGSAKDSTIVNPPVQNGNTELVPDGKITEGDLINFSTNSAGEIAEFLVYYDYSEYGSNPPEDWEITGNKYWLDADDWASLNLSYGYANRVEKNRIHLGYTMGENVLDEVWGNVTSIVVFDNSGRRPVSYAISMSDVKTYEDCGEDCDIVIANMVDYAIRNLFIYR